MVKRITAVVILIFCFIMAQYEAIDINFDTQLLRSDEKQDILNLKNDISHFFTSTSWDDTYSDLNIPLHIEIIFEGLTSKGNEKIYTCQALFSNGKDLRYFDNKVQFIYNTGTSLYLDPVLFEPLSGFLAFYANIILAGEIDTYEFNGGNALYNVARDIAIRGAGSTYERGWSARIELVNDLSRNIGLRKARLSWYIAMDLFQQGDLEGTLEEINHMLDGIELSLRDRGRDNHTQFFLQIYSKRIIKILSMLGRKKLLEKIKELDPDRRELYQSALDSISK